MRLFTGCFSNMIKMEADGIRCFSIAQLAPVGFPYDKALKLLAPSHTLLMTYKIGSVSEEQFAAYYTEQLIHEFYTGTVPVTDNILSYISTKTREEQIGLLCWEKYGTFCHRHILSNMLKTMGADISEYGVSVNGFHQF